MSSSQFTFLEKGKLKEQIKWMIILNYQFVSNLIKSIHNLVLQVSANQEEQEDESNRPRSEDEDR